MNLDTFQQLVRILMNAGGMYWFGDAIAQGDMFQAAVGGAVSLVAFGWWMFWNQKKA